MLEHFLHTSKSQGSHLSLFSPKGIDCLQTLHWKKRWGVGLVTKSCILGHLNSYFLTLDWEAPTFDLFETTDEFLVSLDSLPPS